MSDICGNKHRGNVESIAANNRIAPAKADLRESIRQWFIFRGNHGGTCEEAAHELGIRYTTCSGRISELKADKWLVNITNDRGDNIRRKTTGGSSAAVLRCQSAAERADQLRVEPQASFHYQISYLDRSGKETPVKP